MWARTTRWDSNQTTPVGSFKPNAFGLYDMGGNVWQWVEDCWNENYQGAPADGSAFTSGDCRNRVRRGSSFDTGAWTLRTASRLKCNDLYVNCNIIGFRLARTLTP